MADPIVVKVSDLTEHTALAPGDLFTVVAVNESNVQDKTKKLPAANVKLFNANQITDGIVTNSKITDGAVTSSKLGAGAVTAGKIASGGISASSQFAAQVVDTAALKDANVTVGKMAANSVDSDQYVDGSIDTEHLANDAVTEAKLGAIIRTVAIPVFGFEDVVYQKNFTNAFRWPMTLNGHSITGARAVILDALSSNGGIGVAIVNAGGTVSSFTIAQGARAGTSGITAAYDDAATDQPVSVNITYSGTTAKGLTVYLEVTG